MNAKVKAIIIEDDTEAADHLNSLISSNFNNIEILGFSDNIANSVKLINKVKPEIIFMDILLNDGNAFQVLDMIETPNFEVIFITAYDSYLEKAIEHYAFNYILKPIDLPKLKQIIDRYNKLKQRMFSLAKYNQFIKFLSDQSSQILLHVNNEYIMINLNDVIKCETDSNYTIFYLSNNEKILVSNTLKYYEELLSHKGFFRAHRSCLLNIKHIKSIYKKEAIILNNREKIRVAQRNKSNLNNLIKLLS